MRDHLTVALTVKTNGTRERSGPRIRLHNELDLHDFFMILSFALAFPNQQIAGGHRDKLLFPYAQ